jgi:hypothetical protein
VSALKPPWLDDEPDIQALLAAVLDRFDGQPGEERVRRISLRATSQLAALDKNDERADQVWAFVGELARMGVLGIRRKRPNPYDAPWRDAVLAFELSSEPILREWLGRPAFEPLMRQWRKAVSEHSHRFADGGALLMKRRIAIEDRSASDVVAAFAGLGDLPGPLTLRQLSAYGFWGDSKVLDGRAELVAAAFPKLAIRERPLIVAVYLPATLAKVIFVENEDTYAHAIARIAASVPDHAFVYSAGFRGTARKIRSRDGALLHFCGPGIAGSREHFADWWFGTGMPLPTAFWGDLDFSSMQMLKTLRTRFDATCAWPMGYRPLLERAAARGSHRTEGHGQVDPGTTGCEFADAELLPAIRVHGFVHQEFPGAG